MGKTVVCRMAGSRRQLRFRALRGWREKARGLLRTNREAPPVALCGCCSIHTVGMRYDIDVALVARNGKVIASRRDVPPGSLMLAPGAHYAFERPRSDEPWPNEGSWLSISDA